jgi:hypothetical protein
MYPSFSRLRSNWLIARLRSTPRLRAEHEPIRPIVRIAHLDRKIDFCDRETS